MDIKSASPMQLLAQTIKIPKKETYTKEIAGCIVGGLAVVISTVAWAYFTYSNVKLGSMSYWGLVSGTFVGFTVFLVSYRKLQQKRDNELKFEKPRHMLRIETAKPDQLTQAQLEEFKTSRDDFFKTVEDFLIVFLAANKRAQDSLPPKGRFASWIGGKRDIEQDKQTIMTAIADLKRIVNQKRTLEQEQTFLKLNVQPLLDFFIGNLGIISSNIEKDLSALERNAAKSETLRNVYLKEVVFKELNDNLDTLSLSDNDRQIVESAAKKIVTVLTHNSYNLAESEDPFRRAIRDELNHVLSNVPNSKDKTWPELFQAYTTLFREFKTFLSSLTFPKT